MKHSVVPALMSKVFSHPAALLINLSLVLYPSTVLFVPKLNGLIFGLILLSGIVLLVRQREAFFKVNYNEKAFYLSIGFFFFTALFITLNAGFVYKAIGKYTHLLFAIPVYIYLRHIGIKLTFLWMGLVFGSIITSAIAFYDIFALGLSRARGLTHPIVFGDLSLVMGCMAIAGLGWFRRKGSWYTVLPVIALLCAIIASVLSQSRGAWVAVPFIGLVFFWYTKSFFSLRLKISLASIFILLISLVYIVPQTGVSYQVDRTLDNLESYSNSEIRSNMRATSVGTRLEMWQASWKMFLDNPLLGVGWGHYLEQAQRQVDQGLRNKSAAYFDHPHSQYFTALASGGILGFVATLAVFLVPAFLFVRYIKNEKSADVCSLSLAGLVLIVAYMIFGLTEPLLDRSRSVNFFAFYLVVFMSAINGQLNLGAFRGEKRAS